MQLGDPMTLETQQETLSFGADVNQLLELVAHSLYSNPEIFLRELISNSSDAADKLRYEALSDAALYENDPNLLPIVMEKIEAPQKKDDKEIIVPEEEVVNQATALWTLPKSDIKDEQYQDLYKHIGHDFEDALTWAHNKVEGKLEYTSLLYIPKRAPFDLYQREGVRGLKLYVKRVFIMDDAEHFMPMYLLFVKGVIDTNDLPL